MQKLKQATKAQHDRLEKVVNLLNDTLSMQDYKHVLLKFYRFYSSIEPKLHSYDLDKFGYKTTERSRLRLLEKDLKNLNLKPVPSWEGLPLLENIGEVFGCLYVIEGSSLGGQVISRHLKEKLQLDINNGASFFNIYGSETGKMWKEFGIIIEEFAKSYQNDQQIIEGAIETFQGFEECFKSTALSFSYENQQ
ncbi:MAG: biliverdin-producing heme oxygenase [Acidobacteriota bacterium]|nr:biliverdin-producing heme oxygenase [Acidobacteriota bacterium]